MTQEQKVINAREFASLAVSLLLNLTKHKLKMNLQRLRKLLLLSCQLAVEFNKAQTNRALRNTLKHVRERVTSEQIKLVCKQGMAPPFPVGWLSKQLNNIGRIGSKSHEEFIKIGASL